MLIDSNQKKLDPQEIILHASQNIKNNKYSPDQMLAALIEESRQPNTILMQEGNTLFVVNEGKNRIALFRALNADIAKNYLHNAVVFTKAMYEAGFDFMVSNFDDPTLIKIFQYVARNPFQKDMAMKIDKMKDGSYRAIVQLGPERKGEQ